MKIEEIFKFIESHNCEVKHNKEDGRWKLSVKLEYGRIAGSESNSLSECIEATIGYMNEIPSKLAA